MRDMPIYNSSLTPMVSNCYDDGRLHSSNQDAERHMLDFLFLNASAHVVAEGIFPKATRAVTTLVLVLLICSVVVGPGCSTGSVRSASADDLIADPSVTCIEKLGLSGTVTSKVVVGKPTDSGPNAVFVGTSDGLYVISDGILQTYIYTPFGVSHIALIDDLTGDGGREVLFSLKDADVPSIQCYNGATWERLWQSATRQPVYVSNMGWSDLQFPTTDLEVLAGRDPQIIAVSTGCCVFGIDAGDGRHLWTFAARDTLQGMAAVSDVGSDGVDDVVVGDKQGLVHLVSGKTGEAKWSKKIAQEYQPENGQPEQTEVTDVATYDCDEGKVVVTAGDGKVRLLNLRGKRCEWEQSLVSLAELPASLFVTVVPDVTADGEPEVLVTDFTSGSGSGSSYGAGVGTEPTQAAATLLSGSNGDEVWQRYLYARKGADVELSYYQDQPVILETQKDSAVRLVSLKNGDLLGRLAVKTLDGAAILIRQFTGDSYVVVSNGSDLAVVSSSGAQQWYYPRLAESSVQEGQFTGDSTPDILLCGHSEQPTDQAISVRTLSVIDGASRREAWRYEVPCSDFTTLGGLSNVQPVPDLTGDGLQDILAYRGNSIFLFNGANGSLGQLDVHANITHLETMKVSSSAGALLIGTEDGMKVIDVNGNELWSSAWADWGSSESGAVEVAGDLNSDNVSDLALILPESIIMAKSDGTSPLGYALGRSIPASDNKTIEFLETTADVDGDGVREIACFEYDRQTFLDKGTKKDNALLVVSPSSGKTLLRLNLDREATFDLACADFNGDGVLDSLVCWGRKQGGSDKPKVEVFSGKDDSSLWAFRYESDSSWQSGVMPAAAIGDATGDGVADLSLSESLGSDWNRISVYDIARNSLVKQTSIPPLEQKTTEYGWRTGLSEGPGPGGTVYPISDLNGDGKQELVISAYQSVGTGSSRQYMGLTDVHGEGLLAYFPFSSPGFFKTGEVGSLGVADGAGLYILRTGEDIRVSSPGSARTVGSPARIVWEGASESSFADVFVDGVRSGAILGTSIRLPLASGEHEVVVRSIDEYGKISYATTTFKVRQLPLASIVGFFGLAVLFLVYSHARCAKVLRNRRAQKDLRHE